MVKGPLKILVIRFSSLGDLVLLTPFLKAVKGGCPDGEVHLVCKEQYAELFKENRNIDCLFTIRDGKLGELIRLFGRLRRERFDTIIDAHNVIRSNLLYRMLNAPRKFQLHKDQLKKTLLIKRKRNLFDNVIPLSTRYLELADRLGMPIRDTATELMIPGEAAERIKTIVEEAGLGGKPLIAISPGARWETKRWPLAMYTDLVIELAELGHGIVLIGSVDDAESAKAIVEGAEAQALNLVGKCSILETAAALKHCSVLVTNDSAPLHIAEAVGTPVIALFGPTVREFGYFPRLPRSIALEIPLDCRPCSRNGSRPCPLGTKECLTGITPEQVAESVRTILQMQNTATGRMATREEGAR